MSRLFGTDGVRGLANVDITAELALQMSVAAAQVLGGQPAPGRKPKAVVGRDPRASGEFLSAAVVAGLASAAWTSTTSAYSRRRPSRSSRGHGRPAVSLRLHDAMPDNGIKFFAGWPQAPGRSRGRDRGADRPALGATGRAGSAGSTEPRGRRYVALLSTLPTLLTVTIVLDAAHGAASSLAEVFRLAGADNMRSAPPGQAEHQRRLWLDPPGPDQGRSA